jgi:hypothetical protein
MGNNSGKENPSSPGTSCVEVAGSDGHEDEIMACCKAKHDDPGPFFPGLNDCQNLVKDCVKKAGLPVPGGRWGSRSNGPEYRPGPWKEDIILWSIILDVVFP